MKQSFIFLLLISSSLTMGQISSFIHVDQFGYMPNAEKVAVISNPQEGFNSGQTYIPGPSLELRTAVNNSSVFAGAPTRWNNGNTHNQSGDKGWWFDFTNYTTPGTYYIFDPQNNASSAPFEITDVILLKKHPTQM